MHNIIAKVRREYSRIHRPVRAHCIALGDSHAGQQKGSTLMYAAHFAAGLAIGSRAPRAPMWVLLAGAFLPDIIWIVLSAAGLEPAATSMFFDDWSHSLLSVTLQASLLTLCFVRAGKAVWMPVWLAVISHFLLDAIIHPRPIALYPHSRIHVPWNLWHWGEAQSVLGFTHYWWVQLAIMVPLLSMYVMGLRRRKFALDLTWATVLTVLGLHLIF
jgi:hypothetical protein